MYPVLCFYISVSFVFRVSVLFFFIISLEKKAPLFEAKVFHAEILCAI